MVAYFSFVVFAGAFFLLNLTLAVINYYFTTAQKSMADEEKAKLESA
jgi:cbb3-type cytochrome oxidase subunit 3